MDCVAVVDKVALVEALREISDEYSSVGDFSVWELDGEVDGGLENDAVNVGPSRDGDALVDSDSVPEADNSLVYDRGDDEMVFEELLE